MPSWRHQGAAKPRVESLNFEDFVRSSQGATGDAPKAVSVTRIASEYIFTANCIVSERF